MTQIVDRLTTAGVAVIILSLPPRDLADKKLPETALFNAWLKEFARTRRLHFVDIHSRMVDPATGGYKTGLGNSDGLHFSRLGAAAVGDAVIETVGHLLPTAGVLGPASNLDPNNLATNGLLLDGPDDSPTGWLYSALPAGVTRGRVSDPSFQGGKAWEVSATDLPADTPGFAFYKALTTGYSPGDRLLMRARFSISGTTVLGDAEKFGLSLIGLFYDAAPPAPPTQYIARYLSVDGHHGVAYDLLTVPEGTSQVHLSAHWNLRAGTSGTYRVGEFGIYNLTRMGVLA